MASVAILRPAATKVAVGGTPVVAIYGGVVGGFIVNPKTAADQGVPEAEVLFVDIVNPASLGESATTIPIQPGQSFSVPAGQTTDVSVNAASSGHLFSAVVFQAPTPYPPTPTPGPFPPPGPTSVPKTIPSYLYQQYADDEDLQAFVTAYNGIVQQYVDWFNEIGLPVYTGPLIVGDLLDWVAAGLYGIVRPALSSGSNRDIGPFNTYALNTIPFNTRRNVGPTDVVATSDDVFKRIITWNIFKGDGKLFNIRWLKRRIMRFLNGSNGTSYNIDTTYQISVTFGVGNQINIRILSGLRTITGGAIFNRFEFNTTSFNQIRSTFQQVAPLANAAILKEAIDAGVLQLPFQFDYVVTV